jgi:hypothetical protein
MVRQVLGRRPESLPPQPISELSLASPDATRRAFNLFKRHIEAAGKKVCRRLKWRGRGATTDIYALSAGGIWILCKTNHPTTRKHPLYWIGCGFYPSREHPLPIVIQFNLAQDNNDPNMSAAFLTDAEGRLYLGHKGRVGQRSMNPQRSKWLPSSSCVQS